MKRGLLLALLVSGCASQAPAPVTESGMPGTTPAPQAPAPAARQESMAIAGLMESARTDAAAGRYPNANASLERALRIEPRNPRLYHQLARVRIQQGQYVQAEQFAVRSNSYAADDPGLRTENWRLIAQAREARGDREGARAALEAASRNGR